MVIRMKPKSYAFSFFLLLLKTPQRKALDIIAAASFLSSLAIGIAAGYPIAPSVVVALAAAYLAQMVCLTAVICISDRPEVGALADRWLGLDIAGLWTVRPGSDEAAMHLELGTLSAAHLVSLARTEGQPREERHSDISARESMPLCGLSDAAAGAQSPM